MTLNIPLTVLPAGTYSFPAAGGQSVPDADSLAELTIDRTVTGGLNAVSPSVVLDIAVYLSLDGGATFFLQAGATVQGGVVVLRGVTQTVSAVGVDLPAGTGRLARATVTVAGGTVAVQGSLVLS